MGERIRLLRVNKGWKQRELGDPLGVSPQVISNWERGYSFPNYQDTAKLAGILDTTTDFLLRGENSKLSDENDEKNLYDLAVLLQPEIDIYLNGQLLSKDEKNAFTFLAEAIQARRINYQITMKSSQ